MPLLTASGSSVPTVQPKGHITSGGLGTSAASVLEAQVTTRPRKILVQLLKTDWYHGQAPVEFEIPLCVPPQRKSRTPYIPAQKKCGIPPR